MNPLAGALYLIDPRVKSIRLINVIVLVLLLLPGILAAQGQDQPTIISNVQVQPSPFSPNNDGKNESTKFSFTISENSSVTVDIVFYSDSLQINGQKVIIDKSPEYVKIGGTADSVWLSRIFESSSSSAGVNEFFWDGKLTDGYNGLLPDSSYLYLIRVEDLDTDDQQKSNPASGKVSIDSEPPIIYQVSASPNPFSPNGDGLSDYSTISFRIAGIPTIETIGYVAFYMTPPDANDNRFFDIDASATTPSALKNSGSYIDLTTGPAPLEFVKTSDNTIQFSFQVRGGVVQTNGDTVLALTDVITINPNDPTGTVYRDNSQVDFDFVDLVLGLQGNTGDDEQNIVQIRTAAVELKVDIRDSQNSLVDTFSPQYQGNDLYSMVLGPPMDDDTYTFIITAADDAGNETQASGSIVALSSAFSIDNLNIQPDTISPADQNAFFDFSQVTFNLSQSGNVVIQVFRDSTVYQSANLVRTLLVSSNSQLNAGSHSIRFDGKADNGSFLVPNGEQAYRLIITATKPNSDNTTKASSLIYVDNRKPETLQINELPSPTRTANVSLEGVTESNIEVFPYLNGSPLTSFNSDNLSGLFAFEATLVEGLNRINILAYDRVRNGPTYSDTIRVVLDTRAPVVSDTSVIIEGITQKLGQARFNSFSSTDTLVFTFSDGLGQVSSIDLAQTSIRVSSPTGENIDGDVILIQPNKARFIPATFYDQQGTYTVQVSLTDSLGNTPANAYPITFNIGASSTGPSLSTITPSPATSSYLNSTFSQQAWRFVVNVTDNSGQGISQISSLLEVYSRRESRLLNGSTVTTTNGSLTFTASENIATNGSQDGEYVLRITANDNDPTTGTLIDSVVYFYDTRPPDTLSVTADSLEVRATLKDFAPGSGINLLGSTLQVFGPTGNAITDLSYENDGDSTLIASFNPPLRTTGQYRVEINPLDNAGNANPAVRTKTFIISDGIQIGQITPADGAIVSRTLAQSRTIAQVELVAGNGVNIDSTVTRLSMTGPLGGQFGGVSRLGADGVISFIASRLLDVDGSDDGRYTMNLVADDDNPATSPVQAQYSFLYDTQPPDTMAVFTFGSGRIDSIAVVLTDWDFAEERDVSGVNILNNATTFNLINSQNQTVASSDFVIRDFDKVYRLVRKYDPPVVTEGVYRIEIVTRDNAGNVSTPSIVKLIDLSQGGVARPSLVSITPAGGANLNGTITQPITVVAQVADRSGSGLNLTASTLSVLGPDLQPLAGNLTRQAGQLAFTLSNLLATDGQKDGRYSVILHLEDNSSQSANLDTTLIFRFDTRQPDTLSTSADSQRVEVSLKDVAGGTGINLLGCAIQVTLNGTQVGTLSNNGDSTLYADFDPPLRTEGEYVVDVGIADRAGNTRQRSFSFFIGGATSAPRVVGGSAIIGSIISAADLNQPLSLTLLVNDFSGTGINWDSTTMKLFDPTGKMYQNTTVTHSGTQQLTLTLNEFLSNDGQQDGRYSLRVQMVDNSASSPDADSTLYFIYDNIAPDTAGYTIAPDTTSISVRIKNYGNQDSTWIASLDIVNTEVQLLSPQGNTMATTLTHDGNRTVTVTFNNGKPEVKGFYGLIITMVDFAGNSRTRNILLSFGAVLPSIVTTTPYYGLTLNSGELAQPVISGITVVDNAGAGIDWAKSTVNMISPAGTMLEGTLERSGDVLIHRLNDILSNDGSADGRYKLLVRIVDASPIAASFDTTLSFLYDNVAPDTSSLVFADDSAGFKLSLHDSPLIDSRETSGILIQESEMSIMDPGGNLVGFALTHDGIRTLEAKFSDGKPELRGIYSVTVTMEDRAGNTRTRTLHFAVGVTGSIVFYPPLGSVVVGNLSFVAAMAAEGLQAILPGENASISLVRRGLPVSGQSLINGDSLIYELADTIRSDGRDDGLYEIEADLDNPILGEASLSASYFTVDNVAPDTLSVEVDNSGGSPFVRARFSDGGNYPNVGGIDMAATTIRIETPMDRLILPGDTSWVDANTLEADFPALEAVGLHRVVIKVVDRAGHSVERRKTIINSNGLSSGQSVAFVEQVPAITEARLVYVSGRASATIEKATLRIFNLRGDLVKTIDAADMIDNAGSSITAEWLLDNDKGKYVMNGVFIYYWEIGFSDGATEKIKKTLAVSRR